MIILREKKTKAEAYRDTGVANVSDVRELVVFRVQSLAKWQRELKKISDDDPNADDKYEALMNKYDNGIFERGLKNIGLSDSSIILVRETLDNLYEPNKWTPALEDKAINLVMRELQH